MSQGIINQVDKKKSQFDSSLLDPVLPQQEACVIANQNSVHIQKLVAHKQV